MNCSPIYGKPTIKHISGGSVTTFDFRREPIARVTETIPTVLTTTDIPGLTRVAITALMQTDRLATGGAGLAEAQTLRPLVAWSQPEILKEPDFVALERNLHVQDILVEAINDFLAKIGRSSNVSVSS